MPTPTRSTAANVTQGDWRSTLARSGLVAKGVLYGALGVLAVNFAMGDTTSEEVSNRGAIELVASQPFGRWLLVLLTIGLFALAAWELLRAATGDPVEGREASDRAKYGVKGVLYGAAAVTSLTVLLANWNGGGSGSGGGGQSGQQEAAAALMGLPGGRWIVGAIGVGVAVYGVYEIVKHGRDAGFMQRVGRAQMDPSVQRGVKRAGQVGYTARGIVAVMVGFFFVVAAIQHQPGESRGLSGALKTLAEQSWGPPVIWLVAIGLVLYGLFSFAEARYRRAT
jgi:hypothetical protein